MKKETHSKKVNGFTLVEVLVVIFIIGLISSILIVNWRKNEGQYRLQRTAQLIVQGIRKAQNMGLTSSAIPNPSTGLKEIPKGGYVVLVSRLSAENTYYKIYADFNDNENLDSGEEVEKVNLERGIIIEHIRYQPSNGQSSSTNIIFTPPDPTVDLQPPLPPAVEIVITVRKQQAGGCSDTCQRGISCSNDKNCKAVKIMKSGWISIIE